MAITPTALVAEARARVREGRFSYCAGPSYDQYVGKANPLLDAVLASGLDEAAKCRLVEVALDTCCGLLGRNSSGTLAAIRVEAGWRVWQDSQKLREHGLPLKEGVEEAIAWANEARPQADADDRAAEMRVHGQDPSATRVYIGRVKDEGWGENYRWWTVDHRWVDESTLQAGWWRNGVTFPGDRARYVITHAPPAK